MHIFKNPLWLDSYLFNYNSVRDIPLSKVQEVNERLITLETESPEVSIVIAAWNEEINILSCIASLSAMETTIPFEIVVINNNSTDNTQEVLNKLNIRSYFQAKQGCGPSRQLGQEMARGKYILLADADCVYPKRWLDHMVDKLKQSNVVCVYGRYSFISERNYPRWKLFAFERLKDIIAKGRHYKRPYLNAYGISMGYHRELGLKVGYIDHNTRGDDGRLCFDLMKFGVVKEIKSESSRVWTRPRTLQRDGNFERALFNRLWVELKRIPSLFKPHKPHDTKLSSN